MNKPTSEQIKEFWEWCGIKFKHIEGEGWAWYNPDKCDWFYGSPDER